MAETKNGHSIPLEKFFEMWPFRRKRSEWELWEDGKWMAIAQDCVQ
jgi:hypothetical protein